MGQGESWLVRQNSKPIGKEKADTPAAHSSADSLLQPSNTPTVIYCWRCKGSHVPRSCPSYILNSRSKSANNPNSRQPNYSQPHHFQQSSNSPQPRPLPTQTIESQNKAWHIQNSLHRVTPILPEWSGILLAECIGSGIMGRGSTPSVR